MNELKRSKQADRIANIYRCALYMARGSPEIALQFLHKTPLTEFNHLSVRQLTTEKDRKYWAEKILDRYLRLKNQFMT